MAKQKEKPPTAEAFTTEALTLTCKVCGAVLGGLTIHLRTHGLSPDQYRAKFNLPPSYPMLAPGLTRKGIKLGPRKPKIGTALVPYESKGPQLHFVVDLYQPEISPSLFDTIDAFLRKNKIGEVAQATVRNAPNLIVFRKDKS